MSTFSPLFWKIIVALAIVFAVIITIPSTMDVIWQIKDVIDSGNIKVGM